MQPDEHHSSKAGLDIVKLTAKVNLLFALLSHSREELARQRGAFHDELENRDRKIAELTHELQRRDQTIGAQQNYIDQLKKSTSWCVTAPLRILGKSIQRVR